MNANERQAVDEIRQVMDSTSMPKTAMYSHHVGRLLAIIDRHDRLASEGLTERSRQFLIRYHGVPVPGVPSDAREFLDIVERLQAQLAAAKDAAAVAEGIAGDALEDRGLPRLEEVRRETAMQCAEIAEREPRTWATDAPDPQRRAADSIRRRFGLSAPADQ